MSHLTYIKTRFQNLFYLEKAIQALDIDYNYEEKISSDLNTSVTNLIIPQSNGHDIRFCWNKVEYELVVDLDFWKKSYPMETFIDQITKQYASEVIIGESQKIGFQPIKYQKNSDGSNTLVLERWKTS